MCGSSYMCCVSPICLCRRWRICACVCVCSRMFLYACMRVEASPVRLCVCASFIANACLRLCMCVRARMYTYLVGCCCARVCVYEYDDRATVIYYLICMCAVVGEFSSYYGSYRFASSSLKVISGEIKPNCCVSQSGE